MWTGPCEQARGSPVVSGHLRPVGAQSPPPRGFTDGHRQTITQLGGCGQYQMGVDGDCPVACGVRRQRKGDVCQGEDHAAVADRKEVEMILPHGHGKSYAVCSDVDQLHAKAARVVVGLEELLDSFRFKPRHGWAG